jgi:hypothetical protein
LVSAAVALLFTAALLAGCGSSGGVPEGPSSRELALERAQFKELSAGLRSAEGAVQREVSASRAAWPPIAGGLPQTLPVALRSAVSRAGASAGALPEPLFARNPRRLTGPAAGIASLYESYARLAERGWRLTDAGIRAIVSADPAAASFERQNSSLYIDAIYDGHFDLSLVGKALTSGYEQLGGAAAFGTTLPQNELNALAAAYSIPTVRLTPHPAGAAKEG